VRGAMELARASRGGRAEVAARSLQRGWRQPRRRSRRAARAMAEVAARRPWHDGARPGYSRRLRRATFCHARKYQIPHGISILRRGEKTTPTTLLRPAIRPRSTGFRRRLVRRRSSRLQAKRGCFRKNGDEETEEEMALYMP
jgi:hypothetical protein